MDWSVAQLVPASIFDVVDRTVTIRPALDLYNDCDHRLACSATVARKDHPDAAPEQQTAMTLLWAAMSVGATYGLVALAFNVVLSNSGVFNFALPQFVMLGSFLGYQLLSVAEVPVLLAIAVCAVAGALLGLVEEYVAIRPLGAASGHAALITTVGAAVVLQGAAMVIWGTTPRSVSFPGSTKAVDLLGGRVGVLDLVLIGLCIGMALAFHWASRRTRLGLYGRVATSDEEAARLRGVNVRLVRTVSLMVAGTFGCLIGPLVGSQSNANVDMGNTLVVLAFVALALGGFGSYIGSMLAGFVIGGVQISVTRYWGSEAALPVLYALLLVLLLVKPTGLFGDKRLRMI
ncbi:branched-chain amino acid ABC transporter permease [Nocardioides sp. NPDC051685]|uniref:branched-chain amino acid ABC transporter permease n=1 Tax=Nocardioides sp. NPDC051685 TaxID=3364334 RepID=UPI0037A513D6